MFPYPYDFDIVFILSILLSYYVYIFNNYDIVILGFITNKINANMIFNVRKMMTLEMSVMVLKQEHKRINDTQISVIVKILGLKYDEKRMTP